MSELDGRPPSFMVTDDEERLPQTENGYQTFPKRRQAQKKQRHSVQICQVSTSKLDKLLIEGLHQE